MSANYTKNVKTSVKAVLKNVLPGMGISANALNMMEHLLTDLNNDLVVECLRSTPKSEKIMPVTVAHTAVEKKFTGQTLPCALSAGNKMVLQYNAGILKYAPKVTRRGLPTKAADRYKIGIGKSITAMTKEVNDNILLESDAKKLMTLVLDEMTRSLIDKSLQYARGKPVLEAIDIVQVVEHSMGSVMGQHAISEGARNTLTFVHGMNGQAVLEDFHQVEKQRKKSTPSGP